MDAEKDQLRAENERLRARVAELEKTVPKLMEQINKLRAALDEARRAGKRQAAPFRKKGGPKDKPKKPGRKSGQEHGRHAHRQAPPAVNQQQDVPLPECCPHCGGDDLQETGVATQYQTEIPRRPILRQFDIHLGRCRNCGHHVQGRHPLQTSDAVGAAAAQLGPQAHAAISLLNKELGLSHGKVARCLNELFGISIARGTSARSVLRTGRRCETAYESIRENVRGSPWVVPDETGWRVEGRSAWLHVFVGERATCYDIDTGRGHEVAERLLGYDWSGLMIHDGWSPYDCFTRARHQQCLAHLRRRCQELLQTAVGGSVRLPRRVLQLTDIALWVRAEHQAGKLTADELAEHGLGLTSALEELVQGRFTHEPNRKLAKHVKKHVWGWFWFLFEPGMDATNYRAEQAIRPAVVNRKVWGGNRTWMGARAQSVLSSVVQTCTQLGQSAREFLVRALCSTQPVTIFA
jgi:transposase